MGLLIEDEKLHPHFLNKLNKKIKVVNPKSVSYQQLFLEADLLITDYSSLHFDFSFLNKPIVYYQFDQDDFYGGSHSYQKGIFKFERDGFGPVVKNPGDLVGLVEKYSRSESNIFKKYKNKSKSVFLCDKGNSAARIYSNIF
ncbi:putative CDP-glycerol:glycerophosphate glycerophosphotransferase [compost metagenome]